MKICLAQTRPISGDISANTRKHLQFIKQASQNNADLIAFSELSLTGYEPELAESFALELYNKKLDVFQKESDNLHMILCIGVPLKVKRGIAISMIIFQPYSPRIVYSKKYLHPDEEPYFVSGESTLQIIGTNPKIAPAICYEISIEDHEHFAMQRAPDIYLASVAKFESGIAPSYKRLSQLAGHNDVFALMVNAVGPADNGLCVGQSAVWNEDGKMLDCLDSKKEGILILDTKEPSVFRKDID